MVDHLLKANCQTVHLGGFSDQLPPALTVNSGDRISVETYTGFKICQQAPEAFLTPELIEIYHNLPPERRIENGPHLLTGPIYVNDAEPGDVLEVRLEAISPRLAMGFNAIRSGWGALPQEFSEPQLRFIPLDLDQNIAEFPPKSEIYIPLRPFFGILGVATTQTNRSSIPPGVYGGNIDNPELQAGSRLFLPIFVPGALFSIGDGHSAQGEGEVCTTAIETSMNGTIILNLHQNLSLTTPIAETPTDIITMGWGSTLDEAFESALKQMIEFLEKFIGLEAEDSYILCSLAANFRITQVVNSPQKGVHGMISKSTLPQTFKFIRDDHF
jgi:acetamidase/formamidase